MIKVGDVVIPKLLHNTTQLTLWGKKSDENTPDFPVAEIQPGTALLVIEVKRTEKTSGVQISKEWKSGSCKLLSPNGTLGWVGLGWVRPIISDT